MKQKVLSMLALLLMVATGAVAQGYTVTLKEGTEDADKWTITPKEGLSENDQVTITYTGSKRVKDVKAVKKAAVPMEFVEFTSGTKKVKFANMNLGATSVADGTTSYGDYYAWGATEPFGTVSYTAYDAGTVTEKKEGGYTQANGPYYSGGTYSKYNSTDNRITLEATDDAVTVKMGEGYRMPTSEDFQTLYAACGGTGDHMDPPSISSGADYAKGIYWVEGAETAVTVGSDEYKANGVLFVQDATHHIFFPATGNIGGTNLSSAGFGGNCWSSSFYTSDANNAKNAHYLFLNSVYVSPVDKYLRYYGYTVRPVQVVDPLADPLTIEAITAGSITVSNPKAGMQYSLDGGATKNAVTTDEIVLNAGDKVRFYGNGTSITCYDGTIITGSGDGFTCKVYGNIMSLVDEENFATATTLSEGNTFRSLFYDFTTLTDASGLLLPATQLASGCYREMFNGCDALTAAPALPATQLATYCYYNMFYRCSALTAAPELPATQLASSCYYQMFRNCTALTAAPELPATELASSCYRQMFMGCSALTASPVLPATQLASSCYSQMFYNCSKLATVTCLATSGISTNSTFNWLASAGTQAEDTKTFYAVSSANWPSGNNGIPTGWTRENVDN